MAKTSVTLTAAQAEALAKRIEAFAAPRGSGGAESLSLALLQSDGVRCTGGRIGCHVDLQTGLQENICFPAHALSTAMLSAKADVRLSREGDALVVRTGSFQGRFAVVPADRFLAWPEVPAEWQDASADGWGGILQVRFAASTDLARLPEMAGVRTLNGIAYACDNLRICRCAAKGWPDGFISTALLNAVERAGLGVPQQVAVLEDRTWLRFSDGSTCWGANPINPYPTTVIERIRECSKSLKVSALGWDPAEAALAVQRVTILVPPDHAVTVEGAGKSVVFRSVSPLGETKDTVPASVRAAATIHIPANILLEAVGKFEDCAVDEQGEFALFRTRGKELMVVGMVL